MFIFICTCEIKKNKNGKKCNIYVTRSEKNRKN